MCIPPRAIERPRAIRDQRIATLEAENAKLKAMTAHEVAAEVIASRDQEIAALRAEIARRKSRGMYLLITQGFLQPSGR
jgi:uncharacterized small protein (DUF1192 family)